MSTNLYVTAHAVEQFRLRIAPWLEPAEARAAIVTELRAFGRTPKASTSGRGVIVRTRGGRFCFRAVLSPGEGRAPAVVTILRSGR